MFEPEFRVTVDDELVAYLESWKFGFFPESDGAQMPLSV